MTILLSIVTLSIWTFLWVYRTGDDPKRYNGDGLGGGMHERDGRAAPVSAVWGQTSRNEFWASKGARPG